jgi:hypothetical protein
MDVRFALRSLDPLPPNGNAKRSEEYARKLVEHLKLCGWEIHRPCPNSFAKLSRSKPPATTERITTRTFPSYTFGTLIM